MLLLCGLVQGSLCHRSWRDQMHVVPGLLPWDLLAQGLP